MNNFVRASFLISQLQQGGLLSWVHNPTLTPNAMLMEYNGKHWIVPEPHMGHGHETHLTVGPILFVYLQFCYCWLF